MLASGGLHMEFPWSCLFPPCCEYKTQAIFHTSRQKTTTVLCNIDNGRLAKLAWQLIEKKSLTFCRFFPLDEASQLSAAAAAHCAAEILPEMVGKKNLEKQKSISGMTAY